MYCSIHRAYWVELTPHRYWGMTVFFKGKFKYLVHCVFFFLKFEIHFNVYFLNSTFKNDAWYISYFIYFIFCMPGFTHCLEICLQPRAWRLNIISRYGQQRAAKGSGTSAHCRGLVSLFVKAAINQQAAAGEKFLTATVTQNGDGLERQWKGSTTIHSGICH